MENLKKLICALLIFAISHVFAAFNDPHYEGINSSWANSDTSDKRLEIIRQFLPDSPMVFEVGAFDGGESVKFAKLWPNGTIVSFEANPKRFAQYQEKAINFSNMHGYNLAVNTYNGTAEFFLCWGTNGTDPIFEGASSLLPASESMKIHYMGPTITVPCVVLDDWCEKNHINAFDFIWLDLEGFELQFLKSSPRILSTIKVIYTETNFYEFRQGMSQYANLKYFLQSQGFEIVAHWFRESLQGDAIFVRRELLR
jgi:2-O-methyltransferase